MQLTRGVSSVSNRGYNRYDDHRVGSRNVKRPADDRVGRADFYDDRKRPALDRGGGLPEARNRYDDHARV